MTPILQRLYGSEGGSELCDTLMKYLYKGMSQGAPGSGSTPKNMTPQATGFSQMGGRSFGGEGGGQAMSVFLSWHEKLVEMVGPGSIVRVMSDRRTSDKLLNNNNNTLHSSSNILRHQGTSKMAPKKRKAEVDHGSRKKQATETPSTRRITRGMTTDAARRAVFDTAELLENIIMQLPPRKIFVIQRVCKQFRDIVASSVKLQQRLFFRADGFEVQERRMTAKADTDQSTSYRFVRPNDIIYQDEHLGRIVTPVRLNCIVQSERPAKKLSAPDAYYGNHEQVFFWHNDILNILNGDNPLGNTYLTHPPRAYVTIDFDMWHKSDYMYRYWIRGEIRNPNGWRIAELLRAVTCSKSMRIKRYQKETKGMKKFENISLRAIIGDEDLFDKTKVGLSYGGIGLTGCIAPTEEEWDAMAG
ncbi:hypothetical protein KC343_g15577 [Hortaea werneckii]|nr:hypothetical protein KC346_g15482 [Hortaea werneckii]KAI7600658.1 hypothetical protein KC343_g15577 [Hortaea werneckii]